MIPKFQEFILAKLSETESMHSYEVATDTVRCWINQYNELSNQHSQDKANESQDKQMRVIKFRAWDNGQMLISRPDTYFGLSSFFGILREDAIIMQSTGLLDKNGREIYDGDVVKSIRYSESYDGDIIIEREWELKGSVYFSSGTWRVMNTAIPLYEWNKKTIEIIGNIYENPELIKTSHD